MLGETRYDEMGNVVYSDGDTTDVVDTSQTDSAGLVESFRRQVREFQTVLTQLDLAAAEARALCAAGVDEDMADELLLLLGDYNARGWELSAAVNSINAGAALLNSVGVQFPTVRSAGLGLGPLVIPAGALATIAAAVAAAAVLIVWCRGWINAARDVMQRYVTLGAIADPEKRATLAAALAKTDAAAQQADSASFSDQILGYAKWAGIGLLALFAFQAFSQG